MTSRSWSRPWRPDTTAVGPVGPEDSGIVDGRSLMAGRICSARSSRSPSCVTTTRCRCHGRQRWKFEGEASGSAPPPVLEVGAMGPEEAAARKRYEALMQVRAKAVKGKGAWYWGHLDPVLVPPPGTGAPPMAARLRCSLCAASNPSRTAIEHLKRGACSNFAAARGLRHRPRRSTTISSCSSSPSPPCVFDRAYLVNQGTGSHQHHVVMADPTAYSPTPPTPPGMPTLRQVPTPPVLGLVPAPALHGRWRQEALRARRVLRVRFGSRGIPPAPRRRGRPDRVLPESTHAAGDAHVEAGALRRQG